MRDRKKTTLEIDTDVYERLRVEAFNLRRSMGRTLNGILKNYFEKQDKK